MNIKTKKLTLGALAAVSAIAVPVATVVSCGNKKTTTTPDKSKTGTTTTDSKAKGTTTAGSKTYAPGTIGELVTKDKYTVLLGSTNKPGAIAQTTGKFIKAIYPFGYTGKAEKFSITLESKEATDIVKKAIAAKTKVYWASKSTRLIKNEIVAGSMVTIKTPSSSFKKQYYVYTEKGMNEKLNASVTKNYSEVAKLMKKYDSKLVNVDLKMFAAGSGSFGSSIKVVDAKPYSTYKTIYGITYKKYSTKLPKGWMNASDVEEMKFMELAPESHHKALVFAFVKVQGKWMSIIDFILDVKKLKPAFSNDNTYFGFTYADVEKNFKDLTDYTKKLLVKTTPASTIYA